MTQCEATCLRWDCPKERERFTKERSHCSRRAAGISPSAWVRDAAARNAALTRGAGLLTHLAAFLHAGRTNLLGADWWQVGLANADLARFAGIQAGLDLRAGLAFRRIVDRVDIAASCACGVLRAEPNRVGQTRQGAAAEAIAAIGRERAAIIEANRRLCLVRRRACAVVPCDIRVRVVGALAAFRRVVGRDLEWIAFMAPIAIVVAGAGILIEVAIALAGRIVLARDTAVEAILCIVAGA